MISLCTLVSMQTLVERQHKYHHGGDCRSLLNQAGEKGQIKTRVPKKKLGVRWHSTEFERRNGPC